MPPGFVVGSLGSGFRNRLRFKPLSRCPSVSARIVPMVAKAITIPINSSKPSRDESGSGGGTFVIGTLPLYDVLTQGTGDNSVLLPSRFSLAAKCFSTSV